jgi:acid phosphatase family membrane protein YuiD
LVVLCQGKPVHKKMEIFFGILVGAICSTIILSIFL